MSVLCAKQIKARPWERILQECLHQSDTYICTVALIVNFFLLSDICTVALITNFFLLSGSHKYDVRCCFLIVTIFVWEN